ncbi:MAG: hypothetical protein JWM75_276 [Sphingomonas bacterium]|nr:hypothetical protein [Sphingomonas bacterium]
MRNSSRTWLDRENEAFAAGVAPGSLVLDAGAGDQIYKKFFAHCTYEAADFEKVDKPYARSTYVCDLAAIPVEDARFDAIAFNQVMEHLPRPLDALTELNRVLKPGGTMICTAPLQFEEHEQPYDFYRYTQFGWRHLLGAAGFEIERLDWMEGLFGSIGYQLETAAKNLPSQPGRIAPGLLGWVGLAAVLFAKLSFPPLANLFYRIDETQRFTGRGNPKNYVVIARKPPA